MKKKERLLALYEGYHVGILYYEHDKLSFEYQDGWQNAAVGFPISLSMPLTAKSHSDAVVRPFVEGLLPDNAGVLDAWGKRFHCSPRNPYRLLSHVGEECAGAVQFVKPERRKALSSSATKKSTIEVKWLSEDELAERLHTLIKDHSMARRVGDEGHFSLAGAQPKTGLYFDDETKRWGVPYGMTPTTHILKPNLGEYSDYDLNEHYCLRLAERVGLRVAESEIETIAGIPTILVRRFDRLSTKHRGQRVRRVHQEDLCQALSYRPTYKYQNEGGPAPKEILALIRNSSSSPVEDAGRFLNAMIFNWIIGGTDAHAKNYSFLIAGNGQVRLAPFYDLSSCLPYPREIPIRKAKLAMKIGGEYKLCKITLDHWRKITRDWGFSESEVMQAMEELSQQFVQHADVLAEELHESFKERADESKLLLTLANLITERAQNILVDISNTH